MTRWTSEQYSEFISRGRPTAQPAASPAKKLRKYRNTPSMSADGKRFDSKLERDYYEQLLLMWKAGQVFWFVRQVNFEMEGGVVYRADFVVVCPAGITVVDTTGVLTPAKTNKLKQMKARYGIEVQIVRSVA